MLMMVLCPRADSSAFTPRGNETSDVVCLIACINKLNSMSLLSGDSSHVKQICPI